MPALPFAQWVLDGDPAPSLAVLVHRVEFVAGVHRGAVHANPSRHAEAGDFREMAPAICETGVDNGQVLGSKLAERDSRSSCFLSLWCYDAVRILTRPDEMTLNASVRPSPWLDSTSDTIRALVWGGMPERRRSTTPACTRLKRKMSSPKSLSAVINSAPCSFALPRTDSSSILGLSSAT